MKFLINNSLLFCVRGIISITFFIIFFKTLPPFQAACLWAAWDLVDGVFGTEKWLAWAKSEEPEDQIGKETKEFLTKQFIQPFFTWMRSSIIAQCIPFAFYLIVAGIAGLPFFYVVGSFWTSSLILDLYSYVRGKTLLKEEQQ